jgi:hypothetical protein
MLGERLPPGVVSDDHLVGVVPGQTLRLTVFNTGAPRTDRHDRDDRMRTVVVILDGGGEVVARSGEVAVGPGAFHAFDFRRADIALAGEPGTGRAQVRVQVRHRFFAVVDRTQVQTALELVDDATGRSALRSSKPKEIVVVGSKLR